MDDEIIGDVVDPTNLEPEVPVEPAPVEPKVHEPPPESPRFNEIYGKMKEFERQLDSKDELIDAMSEHNQSLQQRMDGLDDKLSEGTRPDAITDPEGHDKWLEDKIVRNLKREQPKPKTEPQPKTNRIEEQQAVLRENFSDYDGVMHLAKEYIEGDKLAKLAIMDTDNPPRALYEYGLKKKAEIAKQRSDSIAQAGVEGGGTPPSEPVSTALTEVEKKMAHGLGITEKQYIAQKEYSVKRGYK